MLEITHRQASNADEGVFHEGELAIQERLGVANKIGAFARRVVRDHMPDQHRVLFAQLPFILAGAADDEGQVWATIFWGQPGFAWSPDPKHLYINLPVIDHDPLAQALNIGADIGLLGIQLSTRRRNRLSGAITARTPSTLSVAVRQSFGNCPKYIQARESRFADDLSLGATPADHRTSLAPIDQTLIAKADTLFIASTCTRSGIAAAKGADVSHRGGKPGFVRIDDANTLTMPDFIGNFHFNTLGNLLQEPRCGLLFVDWERGDLVHVAATAEIIWADADVRTFVGADRLVRFRITRIVHRPGALPLRFSAPEYSPALSRTGDWPRTT